MKVYLAARYTRKDEIAQYVKLFEAVGIKVTSTWMTEPHGGQVQLADVRDDQLREYALRDLEEIKAANIFILFSESDQTANRRGGRHVEHGYALALGKPILVVGPRENIFHYLDNVEHYETIDEVINAMR